MPDTAVLPELVDDDVPAVIEWLCDRFGLTERWRFVARDLGGHHWTVAESVPGVEPEAWGGRRPSAPPPG